MERISYFLVLTLILIVFVYCSKCDEGFQIPQNIVDGGDFHIQPIGAIADSGSFATDMSEYVHGNGPI